MLLTMLFIYLAVGLIWGLFDPKKIISGEVNKLRLENIARIASNQEVTSKKKILVFNIEKLIKCYHREENYSPIQLKLYNYTSCARGAAVFLIFRIFKSYSSPFVQSSLYMVFLVNSSIIYI